MDLEKIGRDRLKDLALRDPAAQEGEEAVEEDQMSKEMGLDNGNPKAVVSSVSSSSTAADQADENSRTGTGPKQLLETASEPSSSASAGTPDEDIVEELDDTSDGSDDGMGVEFFEAQVTTLHSKDISA